MSDINRSSGTLCVPPTESPLPLIPSHQGRGNNSIGGSFSSPLMGEDEGGGEKITQNLKHSLRYSLNYQSSLNLEELNIGIKSHSIYMKVLDG